MFKKNKLLFVLLISIMLFTSVACGFLSIPFSMLADNGSSEIITEEAVIVEESEDEADAPEAEDAPGVIDTSADTLSTTASRIYETFSPGVVSILVWTDLGNGSGSGFVYDKQGHIITNYHVVEGATQVEVDFQSGLKVWAEITATDPDSDLAVLKVDVPADELVPLPLGSSESVKVGDTVLAIGNPYGLVGTMTTGIVSAKGRTMESMRTSGTGSYFSTGDIIQTDATINPGNSGGPLLNLQGEVIGINRAIQTNGFSTTGEAVNTGIGFAISIDIVKRVVPVLIDEGEYEYPYLGISALEQLNLLQMELLGIDHNTGAYVTEVAAGSPAAEAGVIGASPQVVNYEGQQVEMPLGGDLIIGIDDVEVNVFGDLLSYVLLNKAPGDTVTLTLLRNGEQVQVDLVLGSRSALTTN